MTTTSENTPALQAASEIIQKKRAAWSNMGEVIHNTELKLQMMAQEAIKEILIPKTIDDVPNAEAALKTARRKHAAIETERKTVTSRFESVTSRMMIPEKSVPAHLLSAENAIITLKKADEEEKRIAKLKTDNIVKAKEYLTNHKNDSISAFNSKIINKVEEVYSYALGAGNITMEGLLKLKEQALSRFTAKDFTITVPPNSFQYVNMEDWAKIITEILVYSPDTFLSDYAEKLNFKFDDYEIALKNKAQALENSRIEKEAADKKLKEEQQHSQVAAALSAVAVDPTIVSNTKPLKSTWDIDMPENWESTIIIISAFIANINLTKDHLRVNKLNSLTIGQMKSAIAKCKTVDDKFEFTSIIFKQIDKL